MQILSLKAIPSQTLSFIDPDNNQWDLAVRVAAQQIAIDVILNSTIILSGITIVAGYRLIPYNYLEAGNFFLITQNKEIPDYTQFGLTQTLVYATQSEIDALRVPLTSLTQITTSDFDPNGALPLRFAPQGYIAG